MSSTSRMMGFPQATSALERRAVIGIAVFFAAAWTALAYTRFALIHNRTFDLAFYVRIAWGLAVFDLREPIVGAHIAGLHLSPVLLPLGWLGRIFGTVPVLLTSQSVAAAGAGVIVARIGARKLGAGGALVAALAFFLYPNVNHVLTYEFHPGTIAMLPLALLADALDRRDVRALSIASGGVLACREDLMLVVTCAAFALAIAPSDDARIDSGERHRTRTHAIALGVASLAYVAIFALVLHPMFRPAEGSLELHFGRFGSSPATVVAYLATHPSALIEHLSQPMRLTYLPKILAALALLPLIRPRALFVASPVLAINLLSAFPTTTWLDSHYLTPVVPLLVAGALDGAEAIARRLAPRVRRVPAIALVVATVALHHIAGGTPLSRDFPWHAFREDVDTVAAREILDHVPADASIQAPDEMLPHLAERRKLHRAPPPERRTRFVVLDVSHRVRFAGNESLLRTVEEPETERWLERSDHAVVAAAGRYLLIERGRNPRDGLGGRAIAHLPAPNERARMTECLDALDVRLEQSFLEVRLVANGPCPADLALRVGVEERASRVDLIADGLLNPAQFRAGDVIVSRHRLTPTEHERFRSGRVRLGVLRSSGARPVPTDPTSVEVPTRP